MDNFYELDKFLDNLTTSQVVELSEDANAFLKSDEYRDGLDPRKPHLSQVVTLTNAYCGNHKDRDTLKAVADKAIWKAASRLSCGLARTASLKDKLAN